jgi:hypothetical protein
MRKNVTVICGEKKAIEPFNPLKVQSVPRSKHTPSRALKPLKFVHGNNRCFFMTTKQQHTNTRCEEEMEFLCKPGGTQLNY